MNNTTHAQLLPGVPFIESPLFGSMIDDSGLSDEEVAVARQLHERGYAVIEFPDPELSSRIDRIKDTLSPRYTVDLNDPDAIKAQGNQRVQDAWQFDDDVRAIATNEAVTDLLSKLWGRRAFPFQTLNFPVGTQQAPHSDSVHFSSLPERFMCGVWVAFEDVGPNAGPLLYYPGSHRWPVLSNAMIGHKNRTPGDDSAQAPFETIWQAMADAEGVEPETFLPKKGQALIWLANLLHGGSPQTDPRLTRWSQVTHYYFADCIYYTPAYSDELVGRLDLRHIRNIATGEVEPNSYLGDPVGQPTAAGTSTKAKRSALAKFFRPGADQSKVAQPATAAVMPAPMPPPTAESEVGSDEGLATGEPVLLDRNRASQLPKDFDHDVYLAMYPDVAASGIAADVHYLVYGLTEGRPYRP